MKIIDISQELLAADVYPGDPVPTLEPLSRIALGDECNLTAAHLCLHNGTHADAPLHYLEEEADVASLPLEPFLGKCHVVTVNGLLSGADMERLVPPGCKRLLLRGLGNAFLTQSAAFVLTDLGVNLVGTDAPSIGPQENEAAPHKELLGAGVVILEGLRLKGVKDGTYFLVAPPIKIAGADGAPVRALLLDRFFCFGEDG